MLEPVTANQTRFVAPGLSADARGVAMGRTCVVLLPSVDRVVGLFRGLSERGHLDDLLHSVQILQVRTPLKSRELIVQIPASSSHVADGVAAVATLMGGLTFTGTAKHFVKFRDSRAPLGYDVDSLHGGKGDFILYAADFVQSYDRERELSFERLVLSLSLEREPRDALREEETALLRVVPGLWRVVTSYLHRYNLPCEVAACEVRAGAAAEPRRFYLLRCRLERRMERLFRQTPGIEVHRFLTERVAVQLGYRHPIELGSIESVFKAGSTHLFSGDRNCLETITGGLGFVSSRSLVELDLGRTPMVEQAAQSSEAERVTVPLRLVIAAGPRPPVRASRIPISQAPWLKKLVYLLPPQLLDSYSICTTADSIYLWSERQVEFVPLGTMFYQAALGVLVPVGYELQPRVHPEVLVEQLGTAGDALVFFGDAATAPVQLARAAFQPLSRRAVAHVEVSPVQPLPGGAAAAEGPITLVNEPAGLFPLWGFSAERDDEEEE